MKEPRRVSQMQTELNDELRRGLEPSAVEPSELELQQWASRLGSALGMSLTPPTALTTVATSASGAAKAAAPLSVAKALPAWKLGAWGLGGVALGAGLSAAVTAVVTTSDDPAPVVAVKSAVANPTHAPPREAPTTFVSPPPMPSATPLPSLVLPQRVPGTESAEVTPQPTSPSGDELSVLHQAQASLRRDPARALTLSARHELEFPGGALAQEREVIAIDALLRLGRIGDARARALRFATRYPSSAHAQRVEQLMKDAESR